MSPASPNVGENVSHAVPDVVPAWKTELNERLAATRTRRLRKQEQQVALPGLEHMTRKVDSRASQLAAKVAQRYANAPSYSDVLAAEARAEAETAAIAPPAGNDTHLPPTAAHETGSLGGEKERAFSETLVEEQAFAGVEPLAVNLIEFPRELVAARRVRPRLAEGPLREMSQEERDQLKIFEVAAENVSQTVKVGKMPADWAPIRLDSEPVIAHRGDLPSAQFLLRTAPLEDRMMAAIFDLALIVAAFAIFVLVFVACTAHPPTGKPAWLGAGLALAGFWLLYQYLFFKYAEGTPGMRYAKIALCTFDDENPTRKAMCRRVVFLLLSAAPLGLGFVWALFDPDRLTWHDRISRIYPRSYA